MWWSWVSLRTLVASINKTRTPFTIMSPCQLCTSYASSLPVLQIDMDHLSHSQVTESYMTSALSLFCVCLFIFIKYNHFWSRERHLVCLICGWGLLQLTALILFGLENSKRAKLPDLLTRSLHTILATISMWGVAIIQVRRDT